eukprot:jgi/Galph1/1354/GphlegSOOS_G6013.1
MTKAPSISYLLPERLAEWLRQGELNSGKLVVVDVRDEDRGLEHIRGSEWLPSERFVQDVTNSTQLLLQSHPRAQKFVFHCQLCKVRGPSCARLFRKEAAENKEANASNLEIYVLDGGFQSFIEKYGHDEEIIESSAPHST